MTTSPHRDTDVESEYEVVAAEPAAVADDVVRIWGNTIGWPGRQEAGYRGYYLDPGVDAPDLRLLRHLPSRRFVGTLGVSPRRVFWGGREIRAGTLSHLCVEKAHRKIRPARLLLQATFAGCVGRYDVLYAIPRTPQAEAFARLVANTTGLRFACEGARYVRVLRHAHYLRRMLPRPAARVAGWTLDVATRFRHSAWRADHSLIATWVDEVDARMVALWSAAPAPAGWMAARDEAVLRWRFDRLPSQDRRYLLLNDRDTGSLVAWFACDVNGWDSGILGVDDCCSLAGVAMVDAPALRVLCHEVRKLGFSAVDVRLVAPDGISAAWRSQGFVQRGRVPVYMRWLDSGIVEDSRGPFHITGLDDDG